MHFRKILSGSAFAAAMLLPGLAAAECTVEVGSVLSLTGPAGPFGQAASKSIEMAFRDINDAGGVIDGCKLTVDFRDSQTQGTVAVDGARQLVDLKKVPVIIGAIISSDSMPILTTVTGPSKVVQISPAASSPSFTEVARKGDTGGYWFRTITSDALQGVAAAKYAMDLGLDSLAVIHVNNDFGVNMLREFQKSYTALGGKITSVTPYNASQASYQAEVTAGLEGDPKGLYLIAYPGDGTTVARTWISQGGPAKFLLNDGMNSAEFIKDVGPQYLNEAYGTSSGTTKTASTEYFSTHYDAFTENKFDWQAPAADRAYDAAAIIGLAIAKAKSKEAMAIRDSIRAVLDPKGEEIHAGPEGFKKALALIAEGKPIRYVGVIGPVAFDQYGDITGPFRKWQIKDGVVVTTGEISAGEIDTLKAGMK
jgi:ABC-type branched-subunit amino acid transport system substrate-binding protein